MSYPVVYIGLLLACALAALSGFQQHLSVLSTGFSPSGFPLLKGAVLSFSTATSQSHATLSRTIAVLQEWCTPLNKTVAGVLKHNPKLQEPSGGDWRDIAEHDRLIQKETGIDPNDDYRFERRVVQETRGLVPPGTLIQRHPALQKLQNTRSFKGPTLKNAKEEVLKTWKSNFSLFVRISHSRTWQREGMYAHHLFSMKDRYPDTNQHPQSELFDYFYMCMTSSDDNQLTVLLTVPRTTFSVLKQFFTSTITALQTLKGRVRIEVVVEDGISGLQHILADGSRPKAYPSKFTRMWLSNVPYALLEEEDLQRFLGCRNVKPLADHSIWGEMALIANTETTPITSKPPTKAELRTWLSHLLVTAVKPAYTYTGLRRFDPPNNLAAFIHLLVYLHEFVGIPGRWLSDFLLTVVPNRLSTTTKPYTGFLPIPLSQASDRLPTAVVFPLLHDLPDNYILRAGDVVRLKARVKENPIMTFIPPPHSDNPFVTAIGFVFYKLRKDVSVEAVVQESGLVEVLLKMGKEDVRKTLGELQIMLSEGHVEVIEDEFGEWPEWITKMRREKWDMVLYRTDNGITVTTAGKSPASEWIVVDVLAPTPLLLNIKSEYYEQLLHLRRDGYLFNKLQMSMSDIPWGLLLGNIEFHTSSTGPPYLRASWLPQEPSTKNNDLNQFIQKLASVIQQGGEHERKQYHNALPIESYPTNSTEIFSDNLRSRYPKYLSAENQRIEHWIDRAQGEEGRIRYDHTHGDLADVVKVLAVEGHMQALLMMANHPLVPVHDLYHLYWAHHYGFSRVKQASLRAFIFFNVVRAGGLMSDRKSKGIHRAHDVEKHLSGIEFEEAELDAYLEANFALLCRMDLFVREFGGDPDWAGGISCFLERMDITIWLAKRASIFWLGQADLYDKLEMSEVMNALGGEAYKAGKLSLSLPSHDQYTFSRARQYFLKETQQNSSVPKCASNLSAVHFELGKYEDSLVAIANAWKALRQSGSLSDSNPLVLKLAICYAKAISYTKTDVGMDVHEDIKRFVNRQYGDDTVVQEAKNRWSVLESGVEGEFSKELFVHARSTCVFKTPFNPTMELFFYGTDAPKSLLGGVNYDEATKMTLSLFDTSEKQRLAFLFGGSGDDKFGDQLFRVRLIYCRFSARHVLSTIIEGATLQWTDKWHFTLIEVHPFMFARLLVMFDLMEAARRETGLEASDEIYATLGFMYKTTVIPKYCAQRIKTVARSLVRTLSASRPGRHAILYGYLSLPHTSIQGVLDPLRKWSQFSRKTVEEFVRFNPGTEPAKGHFDNDRLAPVYEVERKIGVDVPEPYRDTKFEQDVYSSTRALFPPGSLLYRHPALSQCVRSKKTDMATLDKVKEEVLRTWEPKNPVLFQTNDDCRWDQPYPSIVYNPHDGIERFFELNVQYDSPQTIPVRDFVANRTVIPMIKTFFALAIEALKNRIRIEAVLDEAVTGLPRLFLDSGRPPSYPVQYTRMWLSNVPDYTGGALNTASFLAPYVHPSASRMILCNCVPAFDSINEMTYNYTRLSDKDLMRFMGCHHLDALAPNTSMNWGDMALIPKILPPDHLFEPSKTELIDWLAAVFISIVQGTSRNRIFLIHSPNNLALADFVSAISRNELTTRSTPYGGTQPVRLEHARNRPANPVKLNTGPWRHDLQLVLSDLHPLIPFPILDLPPDFALSTDQVVKCKASVGSYTGTLCARGVNGVPTASVVGFAFYMLNPGYHIEDVVTQKGLVELLKGADGILRDVGKVEIMLSRGFVDIVELSHVPQMMPKGEFRWRMGRERLTRMVREGWKMVAFRTDDGYTVTNPSNAAEWVVE
ncbi:hypothetical protein FA15DRAFT_660903 [Coprinopsis marcescibilis]|uniref:Uncharacterized protein n=1 Tax=Coprinopsis marcescibilis TaxID=230819 RepID=A0A5C3KE17_COPMA|nr:hypothetical protein FA15DRAFT_660903 [Coprinopsis marcescibilis]